MTHSLSRTARFLVVGMVAACGSQAPGGTEEDAGLEASPGAADGASSAHDGAIRSPEGGDVEDGSTDAPSSFDASRDSALTDASSALDAEDGEVDAAVGSDAEAGAPDADAEPPDAGFDAGAPDAASPDAGVDAASPDAGNADASPTVDTGAPQACTPSTTSCQGDNRVVCSAAGTIVSSTPCALGCAAGTCATLSPSNLPATICDTPGTGNWDGSVSTINTGDGQNTGAICNLVVDQFNGAPPICVIKVATVTSFGNVRVTGNRALAIVATQSMTLAGRLDASASGPIGGPGASDTRGNGLQGGGGGGGGHATAGANGATAGATGGPVYGTDDPVPLLAGAAGGNAFGPGNGYGQGGLGGGAVELVSCGTMTIPSSLLVITVGGGGGIGGSGGHLVIPGSGGGGGSGGTILLEAASLVRSPAGTVAPSLLAYGGGGGGGGDGTAPGNNGFQSGAGAAGGKGGAGGTGGSFAAPPEPGVPGAHSTTGAIIGGGGGGGAVGRLRVNVRVGTTPDLSGMVLNPAVTVGEVKTH